jgi:polyhydroxyalkanoate synthesis regulator phasin
MVIDRNDIDAFVELDVMALTNHIEVLTKEIEELKSRFAPHDTGHLRTTVSVLTERILELEQQIRRLLEL